MIELGKKDAYIGKENKLQEAVINWLRYNGYYCFHVPNGGKRDGKSGAMFKKQGTLAGVSDCIILDSVMDIPSRVMFKGVAIELKVKDGKVSDSQKDFMDNAENRNMLVILAWNFMDLIEYFEKNIRRL